MEKLVLKIKTRIKSDGSLEGYLSKSLKKLNSDNRKEGWYAMSTDTCGGQPMPPISEIGYTYVCMDNVWVKVPIG